MNNAESRIKPSIGLFNDYIDDQDTMFIVADVYNYFLDSEMPKDCELILIKKAISVAQQKRYQFRDVFFFIFKGYYVTIYRTFSKQYCEKIAQGLPIEEKAIILRYP
jgi:hypothetical protein